MTDLAERIFLLHEYAQHCVSKPRYGNVVEYVRADIVQALTAERDGLLRCVTDNHVALCRAEKAEAERDQLRKALTDALYAWDIHQKHGFQMAGWWVHDASAALKGDTK